MTRASSPLSPILAILFALCSASALVRGQDAAIRHDATTLILPAGHHEVKALLAGAAQFLEINIANDPNQIVGAAPIDLQTPMAVDRADAEEVVCELLFARGLVLTPTDPKRGLYDVICINGPRAGDLAHMAQAKSPEAILARPTLKQPVSTILQLGTINANIAANALRPFFAQAGNSGMGIIIGTAGSNDAIMLSGMQSEIARAIILVQQADVPANAPAAVAPNELEKLQQRIVELEKAVARLQQDIATRKN